MADNPQKLDQQISNLDTAMGSGVLTVESPDTGRVTYRSYDEMQRARVDLVRRRAALDPTMGRRHTRQVVVVGRSGF